MKITLSLGYISGKLKNETAEIGFTDEVSTHELLKQNNIT
jgi:hypothetical protein